MCVSLLLFFSGSRNKEGLVNMDTDQSLWEAIYEASVATKHAAVLWFRIFSPLLMACWNAASIGFSFLLEWLMVGCNFVWPYVKSGVYLTVDLVRTTDPLILISIMIVVVALALLFMAGRYIRRQRYIERATGLYNAVSDNVRERYETAIGAVREKSTFAALIIPHAVVLIGSVLLLIFAPDRMHSLAHGWEVFLIGTFYPAIASIIAVRSHATTVAACEEGEELPHDHRDIERLVHWLTYWTVFASLMVLPQVPVLSMLLDHVPLWHELLFCVIVWMEIPWTDGAGVGFRLLVPFINGYIREVPKPMSSWAIQLHLPLSCGCRSNVKKHTGESHGIGEWFRVSCSSWPDFLLHTWFRHTLWMFSGRNRVSSLRIGCGCVAE